MEKHTEPPRGGKGAKKRRRGKVTPRVKVETEVLRAPHPPCSQFKGYEPYDVQDLVISARALHYRRERLAVAAGRDDRRPATRRHPRPFRPQTVPIRC